MSVSSSASGSSDNVSVLGTPPSTSTPNEIAFVPLNRGSPKEKSQSQSRLMLPPSAPLPKRKNKTYDDLDLAAEGISVISTASQAYIDEKAEPQTKLVITQQCKTSCARHVSDMSQFALPASFQ